MTEAVSKASFDAYAKQALQLLKGVPPMWPIRRYWAPITYWWTDWYTPGGNWERTLSQSDALGPVIININSGPGAAVDSDWSQQVKLARAKGVRVIGYVATGYGKRAQADILADIKRHVDFYGVDGVFLDEMTNGTGDQAQYTAQYLALQKAIKDAHGSRFWTVGNPGTPVVDAMLPAADTIVTAEYGADYYLNPTYDVHLASYRTMPATKFWHIVHSVKPEQAEAVMAKVKSYGNVAFFSMTDQPFDPANGVMNPYGKPPAQSMIDMQVQWALGAKAAAPAAGGGVPMGLVAHIGDSLTEQAGETMVANAYKAAGWGDVSWYGKYGHFIMPAANPADPDTLAIIRNLRANGKGEPDLWVIALGTNMDSKPDGSVDLAKMSADADKVLAEIDKNGQRPVVWVNVGTEWSYPNSNHEAVNAMLAAKMAARGANGHLADWWAWMGDNKPAGWSNNTTSTAWFDKADGTHMTTAGYQAKYAWLAGVVEAFAQQGGSSTGGVDSAARTAAAEAKAIADQALALAQQGGGSTSTDQPMTPIDRSRLLISERITNG